MTLICKPAGRGQWRETAFVIDGARAAPLLVLAGERFVLGSITWRICRVEP